MMRFLQDHVKHDRQGTSEMQSSHAATAVSAAFDDPNLVAYGGPEPVMRLAERCGLPALTDEHVRLPRSKDGTWAATGGLDAVVRLPSAQLPLYGQSFDRPEASGVPHSRRQEAPVLRA